MAKLVISTNRTHVTANNIDLNNTKNKYQRVQISFSTFLRTHHWLSHGACVEDTCSKTTDQTDNVSLEAGVLTRAISNGI